MSTKTYLEMVTEAIPIIRDRKGASRQAIAAWIQSNFSKEAGAMFNARLRTALNKGIEKGVLKEGNTPQRFRIGVLPKPDKPKKKKVASAKKKKKPASKKKKASSKKKKPASRKKKKSASGSKKKKPASKKKKPASKKRKPASKKKSSSKKKKAPARRSRK